MTLEEKLMKVIVDRLGVEPSKVTLGASFTEDLNADSLDLVELIMGFEETFGISIEAEKAENLQTVDDVLRFLHDQGLE